MKGGGDAASAARAVLQTGEYDYAWNMQVEDDILLRLEQGGKGRVNIWATGNIEHIQCNFTDPWTEVDGERVERQDHASAPLRPRGPPGAEPPRRPRGRPGADLRPPGPDHAPTSSTRRPASARRTRAGSSTSTRPTRSSTRPAGSAAPTASGPRTASGSSCSTRPRSTRPRQKNQADRQAGGGQGGHRDRDQVGGGLGLLLAPTRPTRTPTRTSTRISRCTTTTMTAPDPQYFMNQFVLLGGRASKANKWQGRNITRWRNEEYDRALQGRRRGDGPGQARGAVHQDERPRDPERGGDPGALAQRRLGLRAPASAGMDLSGWDSTFWRLPYWYKQ